MALKTRCVDLMTFISFNTALSLTSCQVHEAGGVGEVLLASERQPKRGASAPTDIRSLPLCARVRLRDPLHVVHVEAKRDVQSLEPALHSHNRLQFLS